MTTIFKHTTLIAAALLACAAAPAMAQTSKQTDFTGPSVGVALSSQRSKVVFTPSSTYQFAGTDSAVDLLGSYGFAMGNNWVGTVDLKLGLKKVKFGDEQVGANTETATIKRHLSASFAPGYRVGESGLVYGKVGFHSATVNYTSTSGTDFDRTHAGVGIGLGYAVALSPSMELRGEFESVAYNGESNGGSGISKIYPEQTNFTIGLLYKF
jgi:opacity protein-like surface antigen